MDNGKISTWVISVVTSIVGAILLWLTNNPAVIQQIMGPEAYALYGGVVVAIIGAIAYNAKFPRSGDTSSEDTSEGQGPVSSDSELE